MKIGYNCGMAKRYSKSVTRKIRIRLSPRNAEDIIRQEFTDERENRFIFKMDVKPHNPMKPTIESTIEYKDKK